MKNPVLDAIKKLKAQRVAVVIADADELGPMADEAPKGQLAAEEAEEMDEEMEGENVESEIDDELDSEMGEGADEADMMDAKAVLGRKPFQKTSEPGDADADDQIDDESARSMYDEKMVERMHSRGGRPKSLMERAQMKLHERFGKKK